MKIKIFTLISLSILISSCVSKKVYNLKISEYNQLKETCAKTDAELSGCKVENEQYSKTVTDLEEQLAYVKANTTSLLTQLNQLSVVTSSQAESIKKSLDNINSKDYYIKNLRNALTKKDSLNMALVLTLKGALKDVNDKDIEIKVEGSAVFVSISDKMLFKSGSYELTPDAKVVIGKIAAVLKSQPDITFMVEGHTDNNPIQTKLIKDNWDLSVLRATSVARMLQNDFGIKPGRMIAAGRGEYVPLTSNETEIGKALNRRTRIMILPELDKLLKMIEAQ